MKLDKKIMGKLLKTAKRDKVHPRHLQDHGLDYSSAYRIFSGKATRPTLGAACAFASVTGHKITLVKGRKPKLRPIALRGRPGK